MIRICAVLSAFALMGALVWFNGKPEAAGLIQAPWDKVVHFGLFFVLAGLLSWGLGRRRVWLAAGLMLAYALFDELRQIDLPGRQADLMDFSVDVLGIACGLLIGVGVLNRRLSAG